MTPKNFIVAIVLATSILAGPAGATTWTVNDPHTEINFSVNHFFTPVTGRFDDFEVTLDYDADDPSKSRVKVKIRVASVNTGNEKRDEHLRSADWFDTETYPYMTFESTSVRQLGDSLVARGELTIKGETHEVVLPIALLGTQKIPAPMQPMLGGAKEVASFQATTSVARADFGVGVGSWAATTVVGADVQIELLLEAHRQ